MTDDQRREMALLNRRLVRCTDQAECDRMEVRLAELEALAADPRQEPK